MRTKPIKVYCEDCKTNFAVHPDTHRCNNEEHLERHKYDDMCYVCETLTTDGKKAYGHFFCKKHQKYIPPPGLLKYTGLSFNDYFDNEIFVPHDSTLKKSYDKLMRVIKKQLKDSKCKDCNGPTKEVCANNNCTYNLGSCREDG